MSAEVFCDFLIESYSRKVIHTTGRGDGFVVRQELRNEINTGYAYDGQYVCKIYVPRPACDCRGVFPQRLRKRHTVYKLEHKTENEHGQQTYYAVNDFGNKRLGIFLCEIPVPAAVVVRR